MGTVLEHLYDGRGGGGGGGGGRGVIQVTQRNTHPLKTPPILFSYYVLVYDSVKFLQKFKLESIML